MVCDFFYQYRFLCVCINKIEFGATQNNFTLQYDAVIGTICLIVVSLLFSIYI